jgi:lipoate-protein ligase A
MLICEPVVMCSDVSKKSWIDAKFSPLNDITVKNKKVSGNDQTKKDNVLFQHGTIPLDEGANQLWQSFGRSFQA